jgi:hypothetical protein
LALALAAPPTPEAPAAAGPDAAEPAALDAPALDAPATAPSAPPATERPELASTHTLTVVVKSPPAGTTVEATAFGATRELRDPGVGVHSASFAGIPARFTRLQVTLAQGGVHTPVYDGLVPLTDATSDTVAFVITNGTHPLAMRTAYAPSAVVRMWTEPVTFTRYGWAAVLAMYAAVLLISTTRRA